jgi:hypothetical protein
MTSERIKITPDTAEMGSEKKSACHNGCDVSVHPEAM